MIISGVPHGTFDAAIEQSHPFHRHISIPLSEFDEHLQESDENREISEGEEVKETMKESLPDRQC